MMSLLEKEIFGGARASLWVNAELPADLAPPPNVHAPHRGEPNGLVGFYKTLILGLMMLKNEDDFKAAIYDLANYPRIPRSGAISSSP